MSALRPVAASPSVEPELAAIASAVGALSLLEEVVRWSFSRTPPRDITEVVVQDEFTHDVVVPWRGEVYLVFDTT